MRRGAELATIPRQAGWIPVKQKHPGATSWTLITRGFMPFSLAAAQGVIIFVKGGPWSGRRRSMSFSLATLWHERNRFLPGILAVAFSALLITVQFGILLGLLSLTSIPVDLSSADLWIGDPQVLSVDVTEAIPESWLARVKEQPEVDRVEKYVIWLM